MTPLEQNYVGAAWFSVNIEKLRCSISISVDIILMMLVSNLNSCTDLTVLQMN